MALRLLYRFPEVVMAVESKRQAVVAHDVRGLMAGLVTLVPELTARAYRLCHDRTLAEDLVQDTVERALRFASQYERGTNLRAWAYQILFSVFVTRYRRQRREKNALKTLAGDPHAWTVPTAFAPCEATTPITRTAAEKLASLPDGFRAVLVMVDIEEKSYRDAATELGVPIGTVMSRLHRGRRLLAEKMQPPGDEREAA